MLDEPGEVSLRAVVQGEDVARVAVQDLADLGEDDVVLLAPEEIQGVLLFVAGANVLMNLVVDIAYVLIDKRVRYAA